MALAPGIADRKPGSELNSLVNQCVRSFPNGRRGVVGSSSVRPNPALHISMIRIRYIMEYIYIELDQIVKAESCGHGSNRRPAARAPTPIRKSACLLLPNPYCGPSFPLQ